VNSLQGGSTMRWSPRLTTPLLTLTVVAIDLALAYSTLTHEATKYAVGGIVFLSALAWFVFRPYPALIGFIGLWGVLHTVLSSRSGVSPSQVLGVAVILGFALATIRLRSGSARVRIPLPLKAFAAFCLLYAGSEIYTPFHAHGLSDASKVAGGVVLAFTAYHVIDRRERLLSLCRVVSVSGAVVALIALAQFVLLRSAPGVARSIFGSSFYLVNQNASGSDVRVASTLSSAAETSGFLLFCAGFTLLRYTLRRDRTRALGDIALLAVLGAGIVVTLTKTGVGGLIVMLAIWAVLSRTTGVSVAGLRTRLALVCVVAGVVVVQVLGSSTIAARIQEVNPSTAGTAFATGRGAVWSSEWDTIRSANLGNILIGTGAHSSFTNVYLVRWQTFRNTPPHDIFLWLVVETGLVGLALYSAALFGLARSFLDVARRAPFSVAGRVGTVGVATTVAFVLDGAFQNPEISTGAGWFFMLFAGAALRMAQPPAKA
jgi:O-Antigen ligase